MDASKKFELKFDKNLRNELGIIESQIAALQFEKKALLRKVAQKQGLSAEKLEDLESECGEPFIAEKNINLKSFDRASAGKEDRETAYFCGRSLFHDKVMEGCGWVKGEPNTNSYNDIGPLSGSAGTVYYCRICGDEVGRVTIRNGFN